MSQEQSELPNFTVNHVTNLVKALNHFKPVLVNEKWSGQYEWDASAPNIHQLVNIAFGAIGAMKQFIQEREILNRNHTNLMTETMLCVAEFQNERIKANNLIEGVQTLIGQKHQCFDVLDKLETLWTVDEIRQTIRAFKGKPHAKSQTAHDPHSIPSFEVGDVTNIIPLNGTVEPREPQS